MKQIIKFKTIGSDPEFGIIDGNNNPLPSFIFFDGTKDKPKKMGGDFAILKDNLLVEGNIPACETKEEFVDAMKFLKDLIQIPLTTENLKVASEDILEYNEMWINTPDGQEFGCSKFKAAYRKRELDTPILNGLKRPIGFHIHIGYEVLDKSFNRKELNNLIAKAMDLFVGMPSDEIKYTPERRANYGALGSYRDTSYGMEYRSLGGYFTQDKYLPWVYEQTVKAIEFCGIEKNLELLESFAVASKDNYDIANININEQIPQLIKELV